MRGATQPASRIIAANIIVVTENLFISCSGDVRDDSANEIRVADVGLILKAQDMRHCFILCLHEIHHWWPAALFCSKINLICVLS